MTDRISVEKRSWNMSRIRGKDTGIEVAVRKELFRRGYRFRKNDWRYPGHPDVVLPKYKTAIFINGCFWHRHENCKLATTPKTRQDFWQVKFEKNIENDRKHTHELQEMGWNVITVWECEIKDDLEKTVDKIEKSIKQKSQDHHCDDEEYGRT